MTKFSGVLPAIITPFRNGAVDTRALGEHVEWLIAEGVHGIVPCGTTGEAVTLSHDEYALVISTAIQHARGRVPVIAGAGSNSTAHAVENAKICRELKSDGLLVVTPYYNKPTQDGLCAHFLSVAAASDGLPIILYNVPGRTGVNMTAATVAKLAAHPSIVGLKDASGAIAQATEHLLAANPGFTLFSGEDLLNAPLYALGYHGAISVTANVAPALQVALWNAARTNDVVKLQTLHRELFALNQAMFFESNPLPVKTALAAMGRCAEEWRLPLTPMQDATKVQLLVVLAQYQLV